MNAFSELSSCVAQFLHLHAANSAVKLEIVSSGLHDPIQFCFSATLPRSDAWTTETTPPPPHSAPAQDLESPLYVPVGSCALKKKRRRRRRRRKHRKDRDVDGLYDLGTRDRVVDSPPSPDCSDEPPFVPDPPPPSTEAADTGTGGLPAPADVQPPQDIQLPHPAEPASDDKTPLVGETIELTVLWKSSKVEFALPVLSTLADVKREAKKMFGVDPGITTVLMTATNKIFNCDWLSLKTFGPERTFRVDFCT